MWSLLYLFLIMLTAALILSFTVGRWRSAKDSQKVRAAALGYIDDLERRYEEFVRKRLTLAYVKEEDWPDHQEELVKEAKEIVKPDIDALAAFIAGFPFRIAPSTHPPSIFRNLKNTSEELLSRKLKRQANNIREQLYQDFEDAAKADLKNRWLDYQVGERLG
ncbi:MAG: hypothetical protein AAF804_06655 [Bacteroidota bacterium]